MHFVPQNFEQNHLKYEQINSVGYLSKILKIPVDTIYLRF